MPIKLGSQPVESTSSAALMRRLVPVAFAALLLWSSVSPAEASHVNGRRWDRQQVGVRDYSPCYYFESDFPTGSHRSRISDGRNAWNNQTRELYFAVITGCSQSTHNAIYVKWDDLLAPFNDDLAFVQLDQFGDISDGIMNFNASPDKSGGGTWSWYVSTGDAPGTHMDLWSTAVHEFGHCVETGHTTNSADVMFTPQYAGAEKRTLSTHDKQSINAMYAAAS